METRQCQNCKNDFTIEPDDFSFYEKIKVPPPTFCPECRLIRRLSYRNERIFYRRICNLCNKEIISIHNKNTNYPVYCPECWWSDKWEPIDYGQDFSFSKFFFQQFKELMDKIPWVSLQTIHSTLKNSEYVNMCAYSKNCYLTSHSDHNENCLYASGIKYSKDCVDNLTVNKSEMCYECVNCVECNMCISSIDCRQSYNIYFSKNLVGCNDCVGSVNLVNKSYHIFNKQFTKEKYVEKLKEFKLYSELDSKKIEKMAQEFWLKFPQKYYHGFNNIKISGDYIYQSKNTPNCYEIFGAEDCKYCSFLSTKNSKDCFDYTEWGQNAELVYESLVSGVDINNIKFSWVVQSNSNNVSYSMHCFNCQNLFGCISLRNKEYCIFNRQYTKKEYEELVPKIIKHMNDMPYVDSKGRVYKYGEFFPPELSPYSYNETVGEFFSLTKEQAISQGYKWKDKEERNYNIDIYNKDIPDNITDIREDITDKIIECAHKGECNQKCTEAFKIIPEELQFYRRMNLPLPRLCPNCRHYERLSQRNPLKLWHRTCMKPGCTNEFETSYAPERPEIIYCERCYQSEVY